MKKLLNILLAMILTIVLFSCKDENPSKELILSDTTIELKKDAMATITIESGNGGYEADSRDKTVAEATVSETAITIKAIAEGSTTIVVTDGANKTTIINVTVSYTIPTRAKLEWNGQNIEFDEAGEYGISILSDGVALTDLVTAKRQYYLTWNNGLTEGDKSGGKLVIAESGKTDETVTLSTIKVVQANTEGNYLVFKTEDGKSGELFFNN